MESTAPQGPKVAEGGWREALIKDPDNPDIVFEPPPGGRSTSGGPLAGIISRAADRVEV